LLVVPRPPVSPPPPNIMRGASRTTRGNFLFFSFPSFRREDFPPLIQAPPHNEEQDYTGFRRMPHPPASLGQPQPNPPFERGFALMLGTPFFKGPSFPTLYELRILTSLNDPPPPQNPPCPPRLVLERRSYRAGSPKLVGTHLTLTNPSSINGMQFFGSHGEPPGLPLTPARFSVLTEFHLPLFFDSVLLCLGRRPSFYPLDTVDANRCE